MLLSPGKSLIHHQTQKLLQQMVGNEQLSLEQRFPEIGRIADAVWLSQKIIFEVQISPISAEEVRARNRDYLKAGFRVVWILHERQFNRSRLTPAEIALRFSPHYFTNVDASGKGYFYDQYASTRFKRRRRRSPRLPIRLDRLLPIPTKQLSRHFPSERSKWSLCFEGDLFHTDWNWTSRRRRLLRRFLGVFRVLHHLLLEKTTY